MKTPNHKWVTKRVFNQAKGLLKMGISLGMTAKIVGKSYPTIMRIKRYSTFAEFEAARKTNRVKYNGNGKFHKELKAISDHLSKATELLKTIQAQA